MLDVFLIILALIWVIFAVVADLKTREIPNWLNFSLIIFAFGARFFYSLFNENLNFLVQGAFGFAVFFLLANALYFGRFFAGGDAKLMMALGPVIPFGADFLSNLNFFLSFLLLFFVAGAIFGFISVLYFSFRGFGKIKKDFFKNMKANRKIFFVFMGIGLVFMLIGFAEKLLFVLGILLFVFPYLYFYTKTIDNCFLIMRINSKELTEGDWLYKRVKVGKSFIEPKWEGLSKENIRVIRKKFRFVYIRRGLEFSPVFLISFVIFTYFVFNKIILWNSLWQP
jgi:Flp pilus assembly protein protease CpaA